LLQAYLEVIYLQFFSVVIIGIFVGVKLKSKKCQCQILHHISSQEREEEMRPVAGPVAGPVYEDIE